jgi:hypothetical protein
VSKFVLKPARLLQTRLVLTKSAAPIELDFVEMVAKFCPSGLPFEKTKMTNLRHGMFVGRTKSVRRPGESTVFVLFNQDRRGNVEHVLKRDPTFEPRLIEAYFIDVAEYDAKIFEANQKVA